MKSTPECAILKTKIFFPEEPRENVPPGPAVALDGPESVRRTQKASPQGQRQLFWSRKIVHHVQQSLCFYLNVYALKPSG